MNNQSHHYNIPPYTYQIAPNPTRLRPLTCSDQTRLAIHKRVFQINHCHSQGYRIYFVVDNKIRLHSHDVHFSHLNQVLNYIDKLKLCASNKENYEINVAGSGVYALSVLDSPQGKPIARGGSYESKEQTLSVIETITSYIQSTPLALQN